MKTSIRLVDMGNATPYVPLAVLGYCLTRSGFLRPLWSAMEFPMKSVHHAPSAKLQDIVVSLLLGCRSLSQINTRLCPDHVLAEAWGRERFADQSTLARSLDSFTPELVEQLRQGSIALLQREGSVFRHDFAHSLLWFDIDLTPLPCSQGAEASTKGKFAKKTNTVGNWHGCMYRSTEKRSFHKCIRASKTAAQPTSRFSPHSIPASDSRLHRKHALRCVLMPVSAATGTSIRRWSRRGTCWPKGKAGDAPLRMRVRFLKTHGS